MATIDDWKKMAGGWFQNVEETLGPLRSTLKNKQNSGKRSISTCKNSTHH